MELKKRIIAFARLGEVLRKMPDGNLRKAIHTASQHNGWFTEENILLAFASLGEMLREEKIRKWVSEYNIPPAPLQRGKEKRIGVIMAGNIPMVGFHDFLCVLMSGNIFVGKLSSEDEYLLPAVAKILMKIEPEFADKIHFANKPINKSSDVSAFIATGSNNSARYFEYYFGKYPHIIRKNRNAIAILDGTETEDDLKNLGKDIFQYFGLGCRNVSKIFIPQDYNLDKFFSAMADFGEVINHNKYYNNYIYYRTIYLLNQEKFSDNNFLMLKEEAPSNSPEGGEQIASPVATLFYERYVDEKTLSRKLLLLQDKIQCIVSNRAIPSPCLPVLPVGRQAGTALERVRVMPGQTQSPELWDYADGVDTMEFLLSVPA